MTDFLTRLIARTQGAIPTERLAQPLLNSTFAPMLSGVESPIEVYEEREANPETSSHFVEQPDQESSRARRESFPHSSQAALPGSQSVERPAAQSFELPAELPSQLTDNSSQQLPRQQFVIQEGQRTPDEAHQETLYESVEVPMEVLPNQPPSYSQETTVSSSLNSPTPLTLQADYTQASQQDILSMTQDIPLIHKSATDTRESREGSLEEQELLDEARQASAQQPKSWILPPSGEVQGEIGERAESVENVESSTFTGLEKSTFIENEAKEPYGQTHAFAHGRLESDVLLPRLNQDGARVSTQQDDGQAGSVAPVRALESHEETLNVPQGSSIPPIKSSLSTSLNPSMNEQERIERVEATAPAWKDVTRELAQLEEVGRVEREVLREEQVRVVELIQQEQTREQARWNDIPTSRRIIPSQLSVTRQEQAKEPDQSIQSPAILNTLPTINVSIGRIEVRAVTSPTPLSRPKPAHPSPALSLDEYLKQQRGGR